MIPSGEFFLLEVIGQQRSWSQQQFIVLKDTAVQWMLLDIGVGNVGDVTIYFTVAFSKDI